MIKRIHEWIKDYSHAIHAHAHSVITKKPPKHYLGHIVEGKKPIILIPGYLEKWNFLRALADPLSLKGHPVYILRNLGYNARDIHFSARVVRELIDEKKLKDVILIAHSKGGLIGKHLLAFDNNDGTVKKLIAVATPWAGSQAAKFIPHKSSKELHPHNEAIRALKQKVEVNHKIVSIYGIFDNHVWPTASCHLDGAKNVEVNTHGHHTILFDKKVVNLIDKEVEGI